MSAFLIQVSGHSIRERADPKYVEGAKGPRFCDEPLTHDEYFNASPFWQEEGYGRRNAWETVAEGDNVLLYCTGSVDEHGACLSHILEVGDVDISETEGARLRFDDKRELDHKIPYADIQAEVDAGRFSDSMAYCGQEGFNFTGISERNVERVQDLTQSDTTKDQDRSGPPESLENIVDEHFRE